VNDLNNAESVDYLFFKKAAPKKKVFQELTQKANLPKGI
jgi:hypothetical protein